MCGSIRHSNHLFKKNIPDVLQSQVEYLAISKRTHSIVALAWGRRVCESAISFLGARADADDLDMQST